MHRKVPFRVLVAETIVLAMLTAPLAAFAVPVGAGLESHSLWALWPRATRWISAWSDAIGSYADPYGSSNGPTPPAGSAAPAPPADSALAPEPANMTDSQETREGRHTTSPREGAARTPAL